MSLHQKSTLTDVARLAGVSLGAASRVINGGKTAISVSETTRERILSAARELRYRPNLTARALSGKSISLIGIMNASLSQYHTGMRTSSLMEAAARRGYYTLVDVAPAAGAKNPETWIEGLKKLLSYNPDGLIFMHVPPEELLQEVTCPSVVLSTRDRVYSDIFIDREIGGYMAGLHLLHHGCRKAFFLTSHLRVNHEKYLGLRRAWRESGLPEEHVAALEHTEGNSSVFEHLLTRILSEGATGAFCSNDFLAARLLSFQRKNRALFPDQFSVIGFDGDIFSSFLSPSLTTVVQPFSQCAEYAIDLLIEKIRNKDHDQHRRRHRTLRPGFYIGESCGCPSSRDYFWKDREDRLFLENSEQSDILSCNDFLRLNRPESLA